MSDGEKQALEQISSLLGTGYVKVDKTTLERETENTIGLSQNIKGIIYPANTRQVQEIVKIANRYNLPLYPISRGKNIGYGEKSPILEGQVIVDLGRMNKIRELDLNLGYVTVEPGVTQKQLYDYLVAREAPFWMDVTGAGIDSSIVGNSLEGGFGHSPKGNRRETVFDFEAVLGNGQIIRTGTFPGLGPDLRGLFFQSNFGIVTALQMELMPIPERFESFVVSVETDDGLEVLLDRLRTLRQTGTLTDRKSVV